MTEGFRFTVCTPSYNRAALLRDAYASLEHQGFRDFEWIVVDDGSTDATGDVVAELGARAHFPVRYLRQQRAGIAAAVNRGIAEARGELVLILDSDDLCAPDALGWLSREWDGIDAADRARHAGLIGLCLDEAGRVVGDRFPHDAADYTGPELRYRVRAKGEKWGPVRTDLLRSHPFPELGAGSLTPPSIVWDAIGRHHVWRCVNHVVRVYRSSADPARVTSSPPRYFVAGNRLWAQQIIAHDARWVFRAPAVILRDAARYGRFSFHAGHGVRSQLAGLPGGLARLLWLATMPYAFVRYQLDRWRWRA